MYVVRTCAFSKQRGTAKKNPQPSFAVAGDEVRFGRDAVARTRSSTGGRVRQVSAPGLDGHVHRGSTPGKQISPLPSGRAPTRGHHNRARLTGRCTSSSRLASVTPAVIQACPDVLFRRPVVYARPATEASASDPACLALCHALSSRQQRQAFEPKKASFHFGWAAWTNRPPASRTRLR